MTDQFPETSSELHAGEYVKIILSKYSSIQKINVCTLESAASLDVRVLDFDDPNDRGDKGSKCILQRNDTNNAIIYHALEDSSCQTFICAGTDVQTYPGQVITVKSMESSSSVNVCARRKFWA